MGIGLAIKTNMNAKNNFKPQNKKNFRNKVEINEIRNWYNISLDSAYKFVLILCKFFSL